MSSDFPISPAEWAECFRGKIDDPVAAALTVVTKYAAAALAGEFAVPSEKPFHHSPDRAQAHRDFALIKKRAAAPFHPPDIKPIRSMFDLVSNIIDSDLQGNNFTIISGLEFEYLFDFVKITELTDARERAAAELRLAVQILLYHARPIAYTLIFTVIRTLAGPGRELLIIIAILLGLVPQCTSDAIECLNCIESIEPSPTARKLIDRYWGYWLDHGRWHRKK